LFRRLKVVSDQEERAHIGWTLGSLAAPRLENLPALTDALTASALSTDDWVLRRWIPTALGKLGARARSALPSLARVAELELTDQDDPLIAVEAIIAIDPNATEAQALVRPLADLLRDSTSAFSRQQAAFRLMKFGPSAAPAVAAMRGILKSRNPDGREKAAIILGRIGSAARAAVPDLVTLARDDPNPSVRNAAETAAIWIDRSVRSEFTAEP
jgi:HEAT repeats